MENKEIYGYVYLITNKINGKQYVGQTVQTIKDRFSSHCSDAKNLENTQTAITNAIRKYGRENFIVQELAIAYNQEKLTFLEGLYMSWFNTMVSNGRGYNIKEIINGVVRHSKETKNKMRISATKPERLKLSSEQGKQTRGKSFGKTSKYCGVCLDGNNYKAQCYVNNKQIRLGRYNNQIDAAKAYDIAAIKYFGNDATLNFHELIENYINGKTIVDKNTPQDYSKSGQRGIWFDKSVNKWVFKWIDKDKNRAKTFKTIEDAIKFKNNIEINID